MKYLLLILVLFSCNLNDIDTNSMLIQNINGNYIDNESVKFSISEDRVVLNKVWVGKVIIVNDKQLNFVVELNQINWFYEIQLTNDEWMPAFRYKTLDSDSLTITQDWDVLVKKIN